MKILIIRLSSIGDCVLASPVVEALRERYPQAHLSWAVQAKSVAVVRGLSGLSETLLWDDSTRRYRRLLRMLWRTRRARFDVVLDLQGLDKAGLFMLASGSKRRISGEGAHRIAHWSSTERVSETARVHAREFYLRRAAALDIASDAASRFFPRLPLTPLHRRFADTWLSQSGFTTEQCIVGLNLGAAHVVKQWPAERFAQLAHELLAADDKARLVIFGSRADKPLLERFESELLSLQRAPIRGTSWPGRVLNAVGQIDLLQLAAVAERCSAFVTADTGPMHIAAAVGAPVVALFGPTDPMLTGPVRNPGGAPQRVLAAGMGGTDVRSAMEKIDVERVLRSTQQLVEEVEASRTAPRLRLLVANHA